MRIPFGTGLALALLASSAFGQQPRLPAEREVDLELILAVDVSFSMDIEEQRLQRQGYIAALTSPEVLGAIGEGAIGSIALSYVEWAGAGEQHVIVP